MPPPPPHTHPQALLTAGLELPRGRCYSQLAWGPDGFIAAACGAAVHFLDCRSGEVVARIDDAHEKEVGAPREGRQGVHSAAGV